MSFTNKTNGRTYVKTCTRADHFGNRCGNSGLNIEVIYAQLFFDLNKYEERILNHKPKNEKQEKLTMELVLQNKKEELSRLEISIERIKDMYIEGMIDKFELKIRTEKQQQQIQTKREEIRSIEQAIAVVANSQTDETRLELIRCFKEAWNTENIEREELNKLAKEIIDRIELIREGDNVQIKIQFL
jgi:hypothetical protein